MTKKPFSYRNFLCFIVAGFTIPLFYTHAQSEKTVQQQESQEFGLDYEKVEPKALPNPQKPAPTAKSLEPEDYQVDAEPEKIKPIEAEEFKVSVVKKSTSGKVLLLNDLGENRPKPGKILLLKRDSTDIAAVRVLKNYQKINQTQFAAKIVLDFEPTAVGSQYRSLKKLGDKIALMIKEREKRGKDLTDTLSDEELAKEVAPDDNELDRGIPTQQKPKKKTNEKVEPLFNKKGDELESDKAELNEDEENEGASLEENKTRINYRHIVSAEYASINNYNKNGDPTSYSGFGVRYGYNLFRNPFFKKSAIEDLITAELGLFYYQITGFTESIDVITVFPLVLTGRYNIIISDTFTFYGYLGLVKNNVSIKEGGVTSATDKLSGIKAALGAGTLVNIGPGWAIRLEYGLDMLAVGAALKF